MDIFTHFMVGTILSMLFLKDFSLSIVIYASIASIILDLDVFLEPLNKLFKSGLFSHKGISHSFFGGIIFSGIASLIFSLITGESYILSFIVGFIFYSLHVILDAISSSKIPLFFPISKNKYRFFIDRAINLILALFSSFFLILFVLLFIFLPTLFFSKLVYMIAGFYLIYFTHRFITKVWFKIRLPERKMYIPGLNPFVYYIYEKIMENENLIFKLIKRTQFTNKNQLIFESKIRNNSKEMQLLQSSLILSKKYPFFTKWEAIIPFIKTQGDIISVILVLAESYARNVAYKLELVFIKNNIEPIEITEGFLPVFKDK